MQREDVITNTLDFQVEVSLRPLHTWIWSRGRGLEFKYKFVNSNKLLLTQGEYIDYKEQTGPE